MKLLCRLLPLIGYIVVVVVTFGKSLWPPNGYILEADDITRYHYYQKLFLKENVLEGHLPWWNPYVFSGVPYLEHPQVNFWYPGNLVFIVFPINAAFSIYIALHFVVAMSSMYILARLWLGKYASWIGGLVFGLSTYFVARIWAGHIDLLAASSWAPLVTAGFWLAVIKARHGSLWQARKYLILAGAVLALQIFSGYQTIALFTIEFIAVLAVILSIQGRSLRPVAVWLSMVALGMLLSAVQIIPNYQFVLYSVRSLHLPYSWSTLAVPQLSNLFELLDAEYFYSLLPKIPLPHEHSFYISKVGLVLALSTAIYSVFEKRKRNIVVAFIISGFIFLWIGFGPNAPVDLFYVLWKFLPWYKQLRIPPRHFLLVAMSLTVLAAFGAQKIKGRAIRILVTLLIIADLVPLARQNIHITQGPQSREDQSLVGFFQSDRGLVRVLPDFYQGESLRANFEFNAPTKYHIFSSSGYDSPPLGGYFKLLLAISNTLPENALSYIESTPAFTNLNSPYLDALNIKYIFVPRGSFKDFVPGRFRLATENLERGYSVYENTTFLPRFYLTPKADILPNQEAIAEAIRTASHNPRQSVLLDRKEFGKSVPSTPPCPQSTPSNVRLISYQPAQIELQSDSPCPQWLVDAEVMYPGWTAFIDGKTQKLMTGDLAFRTLLIPAGSHSVKLTYIPIVWYASALVTLVTLSGCLFIIKRLPRDPNQKTST